VAGVSEVSWAVSCAGSTKRLTATNQEVAGSSPAGPANINRVNHLPIASNLNERLVQFGTACRVRGSSRKLLGPSLGLPLHRLPIVSWLSRPPPKGPNFDSRNVALCLAKPGVPYDGFRPAWDSSPTGFLRFCKVQIPQCRNRRNSQDCRGSLHGNARTAEVWAHRIGS